MARPGYRGPRRRPPLEAAIEHAVVKHARERGCIVRKMNGLGNNGWPDRMFLHQGKVLFIEFKREGCKPTPLQEKFHKQLMKHGFLVRVIDTVEWGKVAINDWLSGSGVKDFPNINLH